MMKNIEENNLKTILINLRKRLIDARESMDKDVLNSIFTTFGELVRASYQTENDQLVRLLVELEDSARDALNDELWRSTIPTVEDIGDALS